jgi:WD40 repeat protein
LPPPSAASAALTFTLAKLDPQRTFVGHSGFTVSAALSPDGRALATGGWDNQVVLFDARTGATVARKELGWLVNRVRFSPDGTTLGVAAWTHPEATGSGDSDPAMLLYPLLSE